ncbi:MAG: septum formation initiator family protein [Candidatus Uhrbacteria bacterium]
MDKKKSVQLKSWRNRILFVAGMIAIIVVVSGIVGEYRRRRAVAEEIAAIEAEISRMEIQRQRLSDLLERADDPGFLEREARLRLGLQQSGEEVLIVSDDAHGIGPIEPTILAPTEKESNLRRWWRHIFE